MNPLMRLPDPVAGEAVFLGLGANLGRRLLALRRAAFALITHPEIAVTGASRVYESEYVGPGRQVPYLNAVVSIRTTLPPLTLLAVLKGTEGRLGRRPDTHLAPRPIDLDILLFGSRVIDGPGLVVPHPRLGEREFVLRPLADLAPRLPLPDSRETVAAACDRIRRSGGPWVRPLPDRSLLRPLAALREGEWRAALAVHSH